MTGPARVRNRALALTYPHGRSSTNLARPGHAQCRQQRVGSISAAGGKYSLHEIGHAGAVEDVELGRIFFEDLCEGELFNGAAAIVGRV